jgi:hypothetical protein
MANNYSNVSWTINLYTANLIVTGLVNGVGPFTAVVPMSAVQSQPNVLGLESLLAAALLAVYANSPAANPILTTVPTSFTI